jgi:hypothetical protein
VGAGGEREEEGEGESLHPREAYSRMNFRGFSGIPFTRTS